MTLTLASDYPLIFPSDRPQPGHRLNSDEPPPTLASTLTSNLHNGVPGKYWSQEHQGQVYSICAALERPQTTLGRCGSCAVVMSKPLYDRRGPIRERALEGELTYFFDGVFFILKHHAVCPVHRGLDSALLAEQVEELGGAELIPPLVGSRAEAQAKYRDETLQDTDGAEGRAVAYVPTNMASTALLFDHGHPM